MNRRDDLTENDIASGAWRPVPRRGFPVLGVLAFLGCVAFGYLVLSLAFALTAPAGGVPW